MSMAADNHTTIVGNLVEDPEVRFTNTGIAVTNLRVAVPQRIQQDGQWRDGDTSFLKVNVWRGQAEHLADSLGKGDRVMVTGRLRQRSWETPEGRSGRWPRSRPMRSGPA
jgi:single-strand DNA-binding protein